MTMEFVHQWAWMILVAGLILVLLEYRWHGKWSWSFLWRSVWIACLSFLVLDLVLMKSVEWSEPQPIEVFIDRSDSVAQIDLRRKREEQFLGELNSWASSRLIPVQIYSFADSLNKVSSIDWGGYKTLLSPIEPALSSNASSHKIIVSDGLWTDQFRHLQSITFVAVGDDDEKDLWIEDVPSSLTAFLKNRLSISGSIQTRGFEGKTVELSLWKGSERIYSESIRLKETKTSFQLPYFPEKMGDDYIMLKVEQLNGELSYLNNTMPLKIRTVRDKIRLLHICGRPSQDLKNWRSFLTRQPDVDLVSFYILRSIEDNPEAKDYELSLIPFPYEDLFSVELDKFDVVVLQNFDFNLYFQPFYLSNLAKFVEGGGSLLMMGGDMSFHQYRGSPLERLFPFQFGLGAGVFEEKTERLILNSRHPISEGIESALSRELWTARHKIQSSGDGFDLFRYESGIPFLSIRSVGEGRVATINSDETWKLQMHAGGEAPVFSKLARRLLQYLTFDPEMEASQLSSTHWNVGKKVKVQLMGNKQSEWKIESLYGPRQWQAEYALSAAVEFVVPFPGLFSVKAVSLGATKIFETVEHPWKDEWRHIVSDNSRFKSHSAVSSGRFLDFDDRLKALDQKTSGRHVISAEVVSWMDANLFASWIFVLGVIIFFCADLWLRKKALLDF